MPQRIYREPDVIQFTGLSRTQLKEKVATGQFPPPIRISDGGRAKAWLSDELDLWQAWRAAKRQKDAKAIAEIESRLPWLRKK
jgi:predicted DNA-binding transcriptional regulator AlpA